jgi:putative transposase
VPLRGKARFEGTPKTAEVMRRGKKWVLSVTFKVEAEQLKRPPCGTESVAFDWGLKTLLTQVIGEPMAGPIEAVDNPRWLKRVLERIVVVQKDVSALETLAKAQSGKAIGFPVNARLGALYDRMRRLHGKIARQRNDFYHQLTAAMVKRFGLIVTEKLTVKNMVKAPRAKPDPANPGEFLPNGAARKAGLNRSIHDAAPAGLIMKLRCKAEEAGAKFMVLPTLKLKPTQRCHVCGTAQKRELSERSWRCACGAQHDRDANAARTMLRYAFEGAWWDTKQRAGTAQAAGRLVPS